MKLFSDRFLEKLLKIINKDLYSQRKMIRLIEEAKELPSPFPRLSRNLAFTQDLQELLQKYYKGSRVARVTGTNSMEPLVDDGHLVMLVPFKDGDVLRDIITLRVGDITEIYRVLDNSPSVLHRVIQKSGTGFITTRGDNTVVHDGFTIDKNIKSFCGGIIY